MSKNFEQAQIQFSAQLASLQAKVKALKTLLTIEQLNIYNESILKDKQVFLKNHKDITTDTQTIIDKAFS